MLTKHLIVLGAVLLSTGCAAEGSTEPAADLGAAVNYNMAVHILPLGPSAAAGSPTETPGRRGEVQMERYMTGKVAKPTVGTTSDTRGVK